METSKLDRIIFVQHIQALVQFLIKIFHVCRRFKLLNLIKLNKFKPQCIYCAGNARVEILLGIGNSNHSDIGTGS